MAEGAPLALEGRPNNALLRSLATPDWEKLKPHLEPVDLEAGGTLYEVGDPLTWVYFPEIGLLSVISVMTSGAAIETSIVGREGGIGFVEALGSHKSHSRVIIQIPGKANRVAAIHYAKAFDGSATMREAVHRQVELLLAEARQAIACHSLHRVERRFARWMLECQDLSGGLTLLPLKQEFLAVMLGVQRTTVTTIAAQSQRDGLIRYRRGQVEIIDRPGLERAACECRATLQALRRELEPESVLAYADAIAAPPVTSPKDRRTLKSGSFSVVTQISS